MRMMKVASCPLVENRTRKKGCGIGPILFSEDRNLNTYSAFPDLGGQEHIVLTSIGLMLVALWWWELNLESLPPSYRAYIPSPLFFAEEDLIFLSLPTD